MLNPIGPGRATPGGRTDRPWYRRPEGEGIYSVATPSPLLQAPMLSQLRFIESLDYLAHVLGLESMSIPVCLFDNCWLFGVPLEID